MPDESEILKKDAFLLAELAAGTKLIDLGNVDRKSLEEVCREIREQLVTDHVRSRAADNLGLQARLREPTSIYHDILADGFYKLVVLESARGVDADGRFDHDRLFLPYLRDALFEAFDIEAIEVFHPEQISQVLKDEPKSLFCFLDAQHLSESEIQRLRGFTQETHRVLLCGPSPIASIEEDVSIELSSIASGYLEVKHPGRELRILELTQKVTTIGRAAECQIRLDWNGVSRKHAEIRREAGRYHLIDLHSRNFTYLNLEKIDPDQPGLPLKANDKIRITDFELIFHTEDPRRDHHRQGFISDDFEVLEVISRSSGVPIPDIPTTVFRFSQSLIGPMSLDVICPKIVDFLMDLYPRAERGFLFQFDKNRGKLNRRTFKSRSITGIPPDGHDPARDSRISRSLVGIVVGRKQAVLSQDTRTDYEPDPNDTIPNLRPRSIVCAPLLSLEGDVLGIIQLDTRDQRPFLNQDLDLLMALASHAAIAIQNVLIQEDPRKEVALQRDREIAETLRNWFLPRSIPEIPGFETFAQFRPSKRIRGQFYDLIPLQGDRIGIVMGRFIGEGIEVALMMARFSSEARAAVSTGSSARESMERINKRFFEFEIGERFMTLCLAILDIPNRRVTLCSAGHASPILRRADGRVEEPGQEESGYPLGIMPDTDYQLVEFSLDPGDVLVIYSDGVTDARNPSDELYATRDRPRLRDGIARTTGGPGSVGSAILEDIDRFRLGSDFSVDLALICIGPKPEIESR